MNILFLTLLDFKDIKEIGIYTDLLREFVKNNHNLYIISPIEKRNKEVTKLYVKESYQILKLQIGNTQKTNIIEKGISTLTLEKKFKKAIKIYFNDVKFDLILYSTPPITLQKAVKYVKQRDNAKTYLMLKDIFPQNAVDLGMLTKSGVKGILYKFFRKKEKNLYNLSDYIGCMSKENIKYLLKNNEYISSDIVEICPNSIEPNIINKNKYINEEIKIKYGIPIDKTIFIYGGNLGKPQGVEFIIKCLDSNVDNPLVFFVIVGSGTEFYKLKKYISNSKASNVKLFEQMGKKEFDQLVNACDVGLIFLDKRFTIPNFPSRLLSYMQASLPVIAATDVNSDVGEIIEKGEFGVWSVSGDVMEFNKNLNRLCNLKLRENMGKNARQYLEDYYTSKHSYDIIIRHFE